MKRRAIRRIPGSKLAPSYGYDRRSLQRTALAPLCGRTLVLVAHPDDETGGCAGLLQRICDPLVFFATEGAPSAEFFWGRYKSRENYSLVRRQEARTALSGIGVSKVGFFCDWVERGSNLKDQELFRFVPLALEAAVQIIERFEPDAVLVPAYEGGHPDHDSCSVLGFLLRRFFGLDVWEMPLYHRAENGMLVCRRFRAENQTEVSLRLRPKELKNRRNMLDKYRSQWDLEEFVTTSVEYFRRQPDYDYSRPPHPGLLNYQAWQWPISPSDVCAQFEAAIAGVEAGTSMPNRFREWARHLHRQPVRRIEGR